MLKKDKFDDVWGSKQISASKATDAAMKALKSEVYDVKFNGELTGIGAFRANFVREVISAAFDVPMDEIDALIYRMGVESQMAKMSAVHQHLSEKAHAEVMSS